ncbi:MAG: hypothetical protein ABII12_08605 [Planctomycetota bacterium]
MMVERRRLQRSAVVRTVAAVLFSAAIGAVAIGCQLAYFLSPEHQEDVKAEYGKIGKRKVAVIVWADQTTRDEDRHARRRVGKAVSYHLQKHLRDTPFVEEPEIRKLQEDPGSDWESLSNEELCRKLKCDMVLRIDLLDYTTRASDTRELRRGRVRATLTLYEGGEEGSRDAVYETEVLVTYPPDSKHGVPDMEDADLLHETVEYFASVVARKFYDHEKSMRGPSDR